MKARLSAPQRCPYLEIVRPGRLVAGSCSAKCAQQVVEPQRDAASVIMVSPIRSPPAATSDAGLPMPGTLHINAR
ncbi:hypothetical protein M5D96_009411 [Drosophila gunungcola]|uniref:Uncharacterized protein n=1 Tax=Drosophila gunungcola TaxID=103775 RepID=A0A9Q0BNC1_9MUSC|nr:hypothetical protein M5D96_009411 [Drosophila gunungcola]